jgi:4-hydroxybenzoyl-CoA reductase subunit beta
MFTITKNYLKPHSISDAVQWAVDNAPDFAFLAGGTDLLVNKFQGNQTASCLIDITDIAELKTVKEEGDFLKIGTLVCLDDLRKFNLISENFPALIQAAFNVASPMLRKTATLGGNVLCENRCSYFNQTEWWREAVGYCLKCDGDVCIATGGKKACFSKFVSDTAPVLISLNALIQVYRDGEFHTMPLEDIYTGNGISPRNLPPTALLCYILIPLSQDKMTIFKKLRPREAVDFSSLTTALTLFHYGTVKIVLGAVDPKPVIVIGNIDDPCEQLIKEAVRKARIVDNDVYSRGYRKEMISVFLNQSFNELNIEQ